MRLAAPLLVFICVLLLPVRTQAAIGIEESTPSSESSPIQQGGFSEGGMQHYEKERKFRLQEQKRAKTQSQIRGIVMIVAPVALIVLVTFLFAKAKSEKSRRRSTHRKLKQAEVRRRAGGPEQVLDPRQW